MHPPRRRRFLRTEDMTESARENENSRVAQRHRSGSHKKKLSRRQRLTRTGIGLAVVIGLLAGIMGINSIKIWAAKAYLRMKLAGMTITQQEDPGAFEQLTQWIDPSKPLNILILGTDEGSVPGETGNFRTDVMLLASIDVGAQKAAVVSIPRDTKVVLAQHGEQRINAANAFDGPAGAIAAVKQISGMDINFYVVFNFTAFQDLVDAMGGVPFTLDQDIKDEYAGVLFKGHYEHLTGEEALTIVRARHCLPDGDLSRVENQQKFMKALAQKASGIKDKATLRNILDAVDKNVKTSATPEFILTLAEVLQGMDVGNIEMATVPGSAPEPKAGQPWYFIPDPAGTAHLFKNVKNYVSIKSPDEVRAEELAAQAQEAQSTQSLDRSRIQVKVLNGTVKAGVASNLAEKLMGQGYKGIAAGDAKNKYSRTTVYYAKDKEAAARQVAEDASLAPSIEESSSIAAQYGADVVVVIGSDY